MDLPQTLKKKFVILETLLLFLIIFIQHRFWLYTGIYKNPGSTMGTRGDAYYNLGIFLQNTLNFTTGDFYSLEGDHYALYQGILGATAHNFAASAIFGFVYIFIKNPILIFNLIFFGNIFLTQIGIFTLVKYYTKNPIISLSAAFLFPLSEAVKTFYVGHIHASYYWALPFLTLFLEKFFEKKSELESDKDSPYKTKPSEETSKNRFLNLLKKTYQQALKIFKTIKNNLNSKDIWLLLGIAITGIWLLFAEWHVMIFSSLWLIVWLIFKLNFFWKEKKVIWPRLVSVGIIVFFAIAMLAPLAMAYVESSKIFNTTRTLSNVAATNFSTEEFYGNRFVLTPTLQTLKSFTKDPATIDSFNQAINTVNKSDSSYPDLISNLTFWISVLVYLPWLIILIIKRGDYYPREFLFLNIFLLSALIALGPVIKIGGRNFEQVLLPHFFLYNLYFPLSAIRAIWRVSIVGYIAVLIFWSLILNKIYEFLKSKLEQDSKWQELPKITKRLLTHSALIFCLIVFLSFSVIINAGWRGKALPAYEANTFLFDNFAKDNSTKRTKQVFIWSDRFIRSEENSYFAYQISLHNLKRGFKEIEWTSGGVAGVLPADTQVLETMVRQNKYTNLAVSALAGKKVDLIVQDKEFLKGEAQKQENIAQELSNFYDLNVENEEFIIWKLKPQLELSQVTNSWKDLNYFATLSKTQIKNGDWQLLLNIENSTDKIYVNPEAVGLTQFSWQFWRDDKLVNQIDEKMGEVAILFPNQGMSFPVKIKPKLLDTGQITLKLIKEDKKIFETEVEVLKNSEYQKKLKKAQTENLKVTDTSKNFNNYSQFKGLTSVPVKISFRVEQGVIQNHPQKLPISANIKVVSQFYKQESEDYESYGGFTKGFGQPHCRLSGNYFAEDVLNTWCSQHLPYDQKYNFVGHQLKNRF